MLKQLKQVKEFHDAFRVQSHETPFIPDFETIVLRKNLAKEELTETIDAAMMGDIEGVADGLTDQLYILLGSFHAFGMSNLLEKLFDEVHASNMSKLDENGKPIFRHDGKILKGNNYFKPNIKKILEHGNKQLQTSNDDKDTDNEIRV